MPVERPKEGIKSTSESGEESAIGAEQPSATPVTPEIRTPETAALTPITTEIPAEPQERVAPTSEISPEPTPEAPEVTLDMVTRGSLPGGKEGRAQAAIEINDALNAAQKEAQQEALK